MEMTSTAYSGVYSIPVTPFNEDKTIDFKSLEKCLEFLVTGGSDGIVLPVNVSEASKLSDSEKDAILQRACDVIGDEVPLIAGVSGSSTEHVLERAQKSEEYGIKAIMCMPPMNYSSENDFFDFYATLSDKTSMDIWVQNNKPPACPSIPQAILARIINEIDRVDFLKEESANSGHMHSVMHELCGPNLRSIMGGSGGRFIIDEYRRGSNGIMPSGHMVEAHRILWDQLESSERGQVNENAIETWNQMLESLTFEFQFSVTAYKYFFWKRGIIRTNITREPAKELDKFDQVEADRILKRLSDRFF
jgi:4-hydroxy-tetrahydrodipicolinate synthase